MANLRHGTGEVQGDKAHDAADSSSNPVKTGARAISHGTDPAEAAANDRVDSLADRQGMPFGMLGHPNILVAEYMTTAAQTNDIIVAATTNQRVIVTMISAVVSNATTVNPQVRIGYGTAAVPTEPTSGNSVNGMILSHPGIAPGSGLVKGNGGARVAVGAKDADVRITNDVPTGGQITVELHYYIIDE